MLSRYRCGVTRVTVKQDSYFVITPPANRPLTLETVREHLKIDIGEVTDAYLELLIDAVSTFFEKYTKRTLINTGFRTFRDSFFQGFFMLRRSAYQSLDNFEYVDDQGVFTPVDSTVFYVEDTENWPRIRQFTNKSFPSITFNQVNGIRIDFTAGFGADETAIPAAIKLGLLNHIAAMFEDRGDCDECACEKLVPSTTLLAYNAYRIKELTSSAY